MTVGSRFAASLLLAVLAGPAHAGPVMDSLEAAAAGQSDRVFDGNHRAPTLAVDARTLPAAPQASRKRITSPLPAAGKAQATASKELPLWKDLGLTLVEMAAWTGTVAGAGLLGLHLGGMFGMTVAVFAAIALFNYAADYLKNGSKE